MDDKRVLLLQGPMGPFFRNFSRELESLGATVFKVNFNSGDSLFYPRSLGDDRVFPFRGSQNEWPNFLRAICRRNKINSIYLFGDCRSYHKVAKVVAEEIKIELWVFEEGYLRPDFITLEKGGVNGNSLMSKDASFYWNGSQEAVNPPIPLGNTFNRSAVYAGLYCLALNLFKWRYPKYEHHRRLFPLEETYRWSRGGIRKIWYQSREKNILKFLTGPGKVEYYLVPLQVHCDAQLQHSRYTDIKEFIAEVIDSFAKHAPHHMHMVLKHHPRDRPYRDYGKEIRMLSEKSGCSKRIHYVHDLHLPTLLKNARGTITINSTVGISSLYHGTPVTVRGNAVYDIEGLCCQKKLEEFFQDPTPVNQDLFERFVVWLRKNNQINGSFYRSVSGLSVLGSKCFAVGESFEEEGENKVESFPSLKVV